jgi:hypothetical protein
MNKNLTSLLSRLKFIKYFAPSLLLISSVVINESLAQSKKVENSQIINSSSNKESISDLLLGNAPSSLMFDEDQSSDIDRAVDSFLNNQSYVPDQQDLQLIQDEKALEEARLRAEEEQARNEKSYLYLSSILYLSPKTWIVWIGSQKITSESNNESRELFVKEISKNKVKILWKLSISKWKIITGKRNDDELPQTNENNQIETVLELRPNQTFMLNENRVVEGKASARSSIEKEKSDKSSSGTTPIKQK